MVAVGLYIHLKDIALVNKESTFGCNIRTASCSPVPSQRRSGDLFYCFFWHNVMHHVMGPQTLVPL